MGVELLCFSRTRKHKWMGQDSNLRCFFVTDLQSAAFAARQPIHKVNSVLRTLGGVGLRSASVGAEPMSPGHRAPP